MAGDWIKMRMDLAEDPAVFKLAGITGLDRHAIVGRLYAFWSWADRHAVDGRVDGATSQAVDAIVQTGGFSAALATVKWIEIGEDFISIPKYQRHNGESAKERSLKNQRQARWREKKSVDGESSTEPSTREEKSREENIKETTFVNGKVVDLLPSNIPYKEIVAFYNEHMGKLAMVREMTKKRRDLIRSAWHASKSRQTLKFWQAYFEECSDDPFLNGTGPYSKGHENWRPTFDYLMRPDVVTKVYERAMTPQ